MKYASVCSGVEAASLAWKVLDWEPVWFSEIEPFPCEVLKQRFPNVPNLGDMTKIEGKKYVGLVDLLVGGTPCQDLSVAGKRAGLAGERSSLAIDFVRLAYEMGCRWFVWENVPGCLSSGASKGADFATLLSLFTGRDVEPPKAGWGNAGYIPNDRPDRFGVAWRTLDAQFTRTQQFPFAVPQRRRRVFVVGYFGDWTRAAEVLLEPDRLCWDTPPRFKARERVAEIARTSSALAGGALRGAESGSTSLNDVISAYNGAGDESGEITPTLQANLGKLLSNQTLIICLNDQGGSVMHVESDGNAGTLRASTHGNEQIVCFQQNTRDEVRYINGDGAIAGALAAESGMKQTNYICYANHAQDSRVRELKGVSSQISAKAGTGGCNLPLVQECFVKTARPTFKGGAEKYADTGVAPTVNTFDQGDKRANELICESICFAIDSVHSNSMKSANPNSGFHKEEIAKTLDTTDPNPTKNQGGNVIVSSINTCEGGDSRFSEELCGTLRNNMGDNQTAVALAENIIGRAVHNGGNGIGVQEEVAYTQNATGVMGVCQSTVRRLLPIECERLMGFPDNWTRIPWKGKPEEDCPDSPRYKACGNSMCVNVMQWIGEQIQKVEEENK